jgi:hypothetical protein
MTGRLLYRRARGRQTATNWLSGQSWLRTRPGSGIGIMPTGIISNICAIAIARTGLAAGGAGLTDATSNWRLAFGTDD